MDSIRPKRNPPNTILLKVLGPLSSTRLDALRPVLNRMLRSQPRQILLDLSDSPFLDSAAIALLLLAYHRARRHNLRFSLLGLHPQPRRVFSLYGLDRLPGLLTPLETPQTRPGGGAKNPAAKPRNVAATLLPRPWPGSKRHTRETFSVGVVRRFCL